MPTVLAVLRRAKTRQLAVGSNRKRLPSLAKRDVRPLRKGPENRRPHAASRGEQRHWFRLKTDPRLLDQADFFRDLEEPSQKTFEPIGHGDPQDFAKKFGLPVIWQRRDFLLHLDVI